MMDLEHLNQTRMLALKLSTLTPEDFQWVQAHVPEDTWHTLSPLVDEIRQLNFGLQYAELIELLKLNSKKDAAKQKSQHELMNDLQWDDLLRLFNNETDTLLPLFSSLHDWQWKSSPKFIEYRKRRSHQFGEHWIERPLLKEALLSIVGDALLDDAHLVPQIDKSRWAKFSETVKSGIHRAYTFRRKQPF
jgi:hypothetical protein